MVCILCVILDLTSLRSEGTKKEQTQTPARKNWCPVASTCFDGGPATENSLNLSPSVKYKTGGGAS